MDSTIGTTLEELVKFIKSVSPELWRIAQRQVQVQIITSWLWIMLAVLLTVGCIILWYKADKSQYDSWLARNEDEVKWLTCAIGISALIFIVILILLTTPVMLNPEYYTIQTMMKMFISK